MKNIFNLWQFWAFLSALFAAFTAIFAKIGIAGINSDFATFIRTIVILVVLTMILFFTNQFQPLHTLSHKSILFLILSGIATGASWIAYFRALKLGNASQVAPIDKLSVIFVALFGLIFLGEQITFAQWAGIGLIAAGAIVIAVQ